LIAGPANAGKVELLLDRYLAALREGQEPVLVVPNRADVDRVERELLERAGALFGGSIVLFDRLFDSIAAGGVERRPLGRAERSLLVRRVLAHAELGSLRESAAHGGFAESLLQAFDDLEAGLLEPDAVGGELGSLWAAYRAELQALGRSNRGMRRRAAVDRLRSDLEAWTGAPVFAYGFEDLTGAEWALLEALSARADVTVSLPYEPGRAAFLSLQRTAEDLARLAAGATEELPPRYGAIAPPALAHLERALFEDAPPDGPPLDGAIHFFECAGGRGTLELVGEELLALVRAGTPPDQIGIVVPSVDRFRGVLDTVLGQYGIPYSVDGEVRITQTPLGQALAALLRFAWANGTRNDLFTYLRSPFSGLERRAVDFVEGRLRGRAVQNPERVVEESERLRGAPLPALEELRTAGEPVAAVRDLAARMLRNAYGVDRPPVDDASRLDLRAYDATVRLLSELDGWSALAGALSREDVLAAIERHTLRPQPGGEAGRVAVVDLLRARTQRFEVTFVLGLEEGSLPRRGGGSPFLDDDARRELGGRLERPDSVSRDRYLFYTACTRASKRLYLVREAADDDGSPREASPFWHDVESLFDAEGVRGATTRRPLSALTSPVDGNVVGAEERHVDGHLADAGEQAAVLSPKAEPGLR